MYKVITVFSLLTLNCFAWDLSCKNDDMLLLVEVEESSFETGDSNYDAPFEKAQARVIIFKDGERFEYKNNLFVEDEGNGNFDLQGFAIDNGNIVEMMNIYFEHEGGYVDGYIKKPTFEVNSGMLHKTGYTDWANFDELYCDQDF